MTVITTRIIVRPDGSVSLATPLPVGEHVATVELAAAKPPQGKPFRMEHLRIHDEPWDDSISLRREDMYGDDGR